MKILWRKRFYKPNFDYDPNNPGAAPELLKDYKLMMADDGTPIGCDVCPCDEAWYIVTICPCDACVPDPFFLIGLPIVDGNGNPIKGEISGHELQIRKVVIGNDIPSDSSETGEYPHYYGWPSDVPTGAILWAIEHETRQAPSYSGTIEAKVVVDGSIVTEWNGGAYAPSSTMKIGDGISDETSSTELLEVCHTFTTAGIHWLDLIVVFHGDNGEPDVKYTVRNMVRVGPPASAGLDWIGAAAVVSQPLFEDTCGLFVSHPEYGTPVAVNMVVLKGPFATREDAEYVLSAFGGLIRAYAKTCVCNTNCDSDWWKIEGVEDGGLTHWSGGGGDSGIYCEYGYTEYEAVLNERLADYYGLTITPKFTLPDGSTQVAPWSGIVPPCWWLSFDAVGVQEPFAFDPDDDGILFGSGFWPDPPNTICALDNEESPYYEAAWAYDSGTHEGVPGNSEELADYLESLEA